MKRIIILIVILLVAATWVNAQQLPEPLNKTPLLTRTTVAFKDHHMIENERGCIYVYTKFMLVNGPINQFNLHYTKAYEKDGKIIIMGDSYYTDDKQIILMYKAKGYYCIQNRDVVWTTDRDSYDELYKIVKHIIIPEYNK